MKTTAAIAIMLCVSVCSKAQTLINVGKEAISKQQFMANFNKNYNPQNTPNKIAALKENLDLYIKYKLKVKAAYDNRLDTLPNQIEDLYNFRRQIEGKYLTEEKMMSKLVAEAYTRMQKDIRISHIIMLIDKSGDTVMASKKAKEAYKKLQAGEKFADIAKQMSDDPNAATNSGDLGYMNVFTLPYDLENLAYNTTLNKYSEVYKSNFAYHIFTRTAERPAMGNMQAAQILIQSIAGADPMAIKAKADMVYQKYKDGENFENLANTFSNDVYGASNGGKINDFSVGKYDVNFENTFAALKDNEVSKPFQTEFGWHILKRIKRIAPSKILDDETKQNLLAKVNNDSRKLRAEAMFLNNIMKEIKYLPSAINKNDLMADANAKLNSTDAKTIIPTDKILHTFNNTYKVKVGDFYSFVNDAKGAPSYKNFTAEKLLDEYIKATAKEYYKNNLEIYNPEYKAQLQEFKDGNMLFEIMERNVWNKSATDEEGLKAYYQKNKTKYKWSQSAEAIIFNGNNLSEMNALADRIKTKGQDWQSALKAHEDYIRADSGRFETNNIPVPAGATFEVGKLTEPFTPNNDGNYVCAYILKVYPEGAEKAYDDAKGLVINDYQTKIEQEWLDALNKKYAVKINETVWAAILKSVK